MAHAIKVLGPLTPAYEKDVLTPEALAFLEHLQRKFGSERVRLLAERRTRQQAINNGELPRFLSSTRSIRGGDWQVVPAPADLQDRRVEITGPADRKMIINALNSGARVFMADLEDSLSPTWDNVIAGQLYLKQAVRRDIDFVNEQGKAYRLADKVATLVVRPRGWHLEERGLQLDGQPLSASLVDFGLYFFHNAKEAVRRGSGPYFYLPKLESHLEARLWNQVFVAAQDYIGLPQRTIRATVLIETITAAFEMEEILYELRDHAAGLNAGRWDYIFSVIKRFHRNPQFILPDRSQVTMAVPFMQAYGKLLVHSCHTHGAHAIGGMSAFIPSRNDPEVTTKALAAVRADKEREAQNGFDGTWVAHPDLVKVAGEVFDRQLGSRPHQKERTHPELKLEGSELISTQIVGGKITEQGLRTNIRVAIEYLSYWLRGQGAVAINNLMEDAATAEISRAQLWQWLKHGVALDDGRPITKTLYQRLQEEELTKLLAHSQDGSAYQEASGILADLVLKDEFEDFLTIPAYKLLGRTIAHHPEGGHR